MGACVFPIACPYEGSCCLEETHQTSCILSDRACVHAAGSGGTASTWGPDGQRLASTGNAG